MFFCVLFRTSLWQVNECHKINVITYFPFIKTKKCSLNLVLSWHSGLLTEMRPSDRVNLDFFFDKIIKTWNPFQSPKLSSQKYFAPSCAVSPLLSYKACYWFPLCLMNVPYIAVIHQDGRTQRASLHQHLAFSVCRVFHLHFPSVLFFNLFPARTTLTFERKDKN